MFLMAEEVAVALILQCVNPREWNSDFFNNSRFDLGELCELCWELQKFVPSLDFQISPDGESYRSMRIEDYLSVLMQEGVVVMNLRRGIRFTTNGERAIGRAKLLETLQGVWQDQPRVFDQLIGPIREVLIRHREGQPVPRVTATSR